MRVGVAEARKRFAELLDRAMRGETVEIARRDEVVAVIGPPQAGCRPSPCPPHSERWRQEWDVEAWPDEDPFAGTPATVRKAVPVAVVTEFLLRRERRVRAGAAGAEPGGSATSRQRRGARPSLPRCGTSWCSGSSGYHPAPAVTACAPSSTRSPASPSRAALRPSRGELARPGAGPAPPPARLRPRLRRRPGRRTRLTLNDLRLVYPHVADFANFADLAVESWWTGI